MLNSIRGFFANHRYLRSFIIAFVFVAVFAGFMEIRMRSFVASTNKGGPGTWSEFRPHPTLFWRLRPNLDAEISIGDVHFHVKTNSLDMVLTMARLMKTIFRNCWESFTATGKLIL